MLESAIKQYQEFGLSSQNVSAQILVLLVTNCLTPVTFFSKPVIGDSVLKANSIMPREEKSTFVFHFSLTWAMYFVF